MRNARFACKSATVTVDSRPPPTSIVLDGPGVETNLARALVMRYSKSSQEVDRLNGMCCTDDGPNGEDKVMVHFCHGRPHSLHGNLDQVAWANGQIGALLSATDRAILRRLRPTWSSL